MTRSASTDFGHQRCSYYLPTFRFCYYTVARQGAAPAAGAKTTQQPPDAIQKAMEATLASIALPPKATSASAAASAATSFSPVVALSDR